MELKIEIDWRGYPSSNNDKNMEKIEVKNQLSYKRKVELSTEKLDYITRNTVPDESLTVRQILDKFANGVPIEGQRFHYETDEEYDENETLNPTERPDYDIVDAFNDDLCFKARKEALREKKRAKPAKKAESEESKANSGTEESEATVVEEKADNSEQTQF